MRKIIFNSLGKVRPIWRLLIFVFITFLINIPLQVVLQKLMDPGLLRGGVSATIYFVSVLASLYIQIRYFDRSSFGKYGLLLNKRWLTEFWFGMVITTVQISLFFGVMYFTDNLEITGFFKNNASDYSFDYTFWQGFFAELYGLIVGSSVEEIFFRGFLFFIVFEALRNVKKDPTKRAVIILVLIAPFFGLAHMGNEGATTISTINLAIDAMMMCVPFVITGRLGMSIGMHFAWNLCEGAIFGFAISGNIPKVSLLNITTADNLLTGGVFGPEGSVIFLLLDVVAIAMILYWKKLKKYTKLVHPQIIAWDTGKRGENRSTIPA